MSLGETPSPQVMGREEIEASIPHRAPMLLIDEVTALENVDADSDAEQPARIVCRKSFDADEFFFQGHYPGSPLVPGVILCEACMQAGAVLLSEKIKATESPDAAEPEQVPVATRINDVRFKKMVTPGDTIEIEVTLKEQLANAFFMTAKATNAGKLAVRFEFACALAPKP